MEQKKFINFDDWTKSEFSDGSGRSEKVWLEYFYKDETKEYKKIGLFKYPKVNEHGHVNTYEHISESLAAELAKVVGVPCCGVDLGLYHNRIGSMSYLVNNPDFQFLFEGVNFITLKYPSYDPNHLIDRESGTIYSIDMIKKSLSGLGLWTEFLKIPIFDYFIGNSDRHQSNWAVIVDQKDIQMQISPLYDNGSSLCAFIKDDDIEQIFRDKNRLRAIIHSKSRSRIGINDIRNPTHDQVIEYLRSFYYSETIDYVKEYKNITDEKIDSILSSYGDILSKNRKKLLSIYLAEKRKNLLRNYNL
jgi:hypothetical protein